MISKLIKRQLSPSFTKASFSSLKKTITELFNPHEMNNDHSKIAAYDPLHPVQSHKVQLKHDQKPDYKITKLNNGITILTESLVFPNVVDLGILLNVGVRDENLQTSGSLLSLKNNYHQTVLAINKNCSDIIQTSGGELEMEYDQENTYFKVNCLSHHVDHIFTAMVESALKPISDTAADIAVQKMKHQYAMVEQMGGFGEDLNDNIMRTAYGLTGLGMPLTGIKENWNKLTPNILKNFQKQTIQPENIYICAAGIEDHQEFANFVNSKVSSFHFDNSMAKNRIATEYKGGEFRNENGSEEITLGLVFKTVAWSDNSVFVYQVLNTLLGSSASFSTGGPGKGMHSRATKNLLNKLSYVDSANSLCSCFSDSGLFGLILSGPASSGNDLLRTLTNEVKGLAQPIPEIELQRAKNITKSNILMALERQKDRLEESVKTLKTFGRVTFNEYCENIDKVTSEQINMAVTRMTLTPPTFVAEGGSISKLPNYQKIQNMLKI